jgi:hypothetical protein
MGAKDLRSVDNDYLQRCPVSRRVNSSKADENDETLIAPVEPPLPELKSA